MLIVTTNGIPGYRVEAVLGEVMGLTVRSTNFGSNIAAGLRSLGGGEHPELTNVVYESRNEVMSRLWAECLRRGGNAVVGMRFNTGELGKNVTEVYAYGTAVVVTPIPDGEPGSTPQSSARAAAANPGPGNWPRMEQGMRPDQGFGTPPPAPDFGAGHRPQAGQEQQPGDTGHRPHEAPDQPGTQVDRAPTDYPVEGAGETESSEPGETPLDDAPTNQFPRPNAEPHQAPHHQTASHQPSPGQPSPGQAPRAMRPQDQRPNAEDSWLDLNN